MIVEENGIPRLARKEESVERVKEQNEGGVLKGFGHSNEFLKHQSVSIQDGVTANTTRAPIQLPS